MSLGLSRIIWIYCSEECRAKTKSPFTHYRKTIKSKGLSSFKWHELCNLCGKTNKTYYVCIASKTCKECHNKKVKRIRTTKEGRQKYRNQYNAWRNKKRINDPAFKIHENIRTR
jgi:hypothetical protein